MITYQSNSHAGEGKINEDVIVIKEIPNVGYFAVLADGMSGCDCPYFAANTVTETIISSFNPYTPKHSIEQGLHKANDVIRRESMTKHCKLACAVSIIYITQDEITYASVGNVRIIASLKDGKTTQLTSDDVYIAQNGNKFLSAAINGRELKELNIHSISTNNLSTILICSDGYYDQDPQDDSSYAKFSLHD